MKLQETEITQIIEEARKEHPDIDIQYKREEGFAGKIMLQKGNFYYDFDLVYLERHLVEVLLREAFREFATINKVEK